MNSLQGLKERQLTSAVCASTKWLGLEVVLDLVSHLKQRYRAHRTQGLQASQTSHTLITGPVSQAPALCHTLCSAPLWTAITQRWQSGHHHLMTPSKPSGNKQGLIISGSPYQTPVIIISIPRVDKERLVSREKCNNLIPTTSLAKFSILPFVSDSSVFRRQVPEWLNSTSSTATP